MSDTVLRTIELTKRYKSRLAVDHLNIEVRRGDVFGFLGPNGAGKSTTIRMILHLVFPSEGDVEIFGKSLKKTRHKAMAKVGAVVEKPAFYNHLSALRNLEILGGLQKPVSRRQIMEHLEQVGLADRAMEPVKTYSHGMNQRLGLALTLLTEEPIPVDKRPGDTVVGGTINGEGLLKLTATRVGKDTALAQIIRLVQQAQGSKAPIQALADRVAAVFVPAIIGIAAVVFVVWLALTGEFVPSMIRLVAVLVIACSCALGLATPTAIMAGTGKGAEKGILFKNSEALELSTRLKAVILDKTGTITMGKPSVSDVVPAGDNGESEEEILRLAASVEKGSEHPLGKAIAAEAEHRGIPLSDPEDFKAAGALGVTGKIGGEEIRVGKPRWFEEKALSGVSGRIGALQSQGKTVMAVARDGRIFGLIAVSDSLKPESEEAISRLRRQNLQVVMLTGDNEQTAKAIAEKVGIEEIAAEVRPEDKASKVKEIQETGILVGMVGDGINDAPALAQADVGFAIGTGTDVAIETADVILSSGSLTGIPRAIRLSRATMNTVRQNLFWAFFYNIILIPIAAGVLYPFESLPGFLRQLHPILAALAMAFSSVSVVTNSFRLSRAKIG